MTLSRQKSLHGATLTCEIEGVVGRTVTFLFGFEKNERGNVSDKELEALQALADDLLKLSSRDLDAQVESGALQEICHDNQD
jgi:hypothetical protein